MYKALVLFLFAAFVGIASYLIDEMGVNLPTRPLDPVTESIKKDFAEIQTTKEFPPEFQQVHKVYVSDHRTKKVAIDWPQISTHHFPQKTDGLYDLQIEVFDDGSVTMENGQVSGNSIMILQFSLMDLKSRNKILEISRSYKLSDLPVPASSR